LENGRSENKRIERENQKREKLESERTENIRLVNDTLVKEKTNKGKLKKDKNNEKIEINKKQNINNNDEMLNKTETLVIATNDFYGQSYDHLDIKKDEFLIVTNWNGGEKGWVYGHRKGNEKEKGIFPEVFIKIYKLENKEKHTLKSEITPEYKIKFEEKINQFRSLKEMNFANLNEMNFSDSNTIISVYRNYLFNDEFNGIMKKNPQELKKKINDTL